MGGNFKFQVQDSDLEYLFWQCEKHITLSEKKPPLAYQTQKYRLNDVTVSIQICRSKIFTIKAHADLCVIDFKCHYKRAEFS